MRLRRQLGGTFSREYRLVETVAGDQVTFLSSSHYFPFPAWARSGLRLKTGIVRRIVRHRVAWQA